MLRLLKRRELVLKFATGLHKSQQVIRDKFNDKKILWEMYLHTHMNYEGLPRKV